MPTYLFEQCDCQDDIAEFEMIVPIAERDNQHCIFCGDVLKRKIAFTGLTWAPTAGGMR